MVWGLNWKLRDSTSESMNFSYFCNRSARRCSLLLAALLLGVGSFFRFCRP